jgi:hypothetical protein
MLRDGLTNCTDCGEHFRTMEALWMHEASTHPPTGRAVARVGASARGSDAPTKREYCRIDVSEPNARMESPFAD